MSNLSRTKNSMKNISFGFANKFLTIILTFVSKWIFVRVLSTDYLGINAIFSDVLMMLSLTELGMGTAIIYSFYKPLAENDERKVAALINFYKKVYTYIALAVAIIGVAITPFLDFILNLQEPIPHIKIYYLLSVGNTVISYLFVYKSSILIADQKGHEISKYSMWTSVVKLILQSGILYYTHSYMLYSAVVIITTVANNILVSRKADKLYPYIKQKATLDKDVIKDIFTNIKSLFIYKFSSVIMQGTDNILISKIVSTGIAGLYSNYYTLTQNLGAISGIIFSSLTASIGNLVIKETPEKRYSIFKTMQFVSSWLSGIFTVTLYVMADDFIHLWLGESFVLDHFAVVAMVINFYMSICLHPIWIFREATGMFYKIRYIIAIAAVVNLICSIVLGNLFGVGGIILATFIAKLSTYFWYEPLILFKDFLGRSAYEYFINQFKNLIIVFLMGLIIPKILMNIVVTSYLIWVMKATLCFTLVNVIYLLLNFRNNEMSILINKVKCYIK